MNISQSSYPVYYNPSFEEVVALAATKWDTIRIITSGPDECDITLGNGYSHTHSSLLRALTARRLANSVTAWSYVMFRYHGRAFMNLEDVSGSRYAPYEEWSQYFTDEQLAILKDLVRESDLAS